MKSRSFEIGLKLSPSVFPIPLRSRGALTTFVKNIVAGTSPLSAGESWSFIEHRGVTKSIQSRRTYGYRRIEEANQGRGDEGPE
jgi:hypothetical protein